MTELSGFVLERSVERGWDHFERWLADVLSAMADGDVLVISREPGAVDDGHAQQPHVRFCAWGDDIVRAEASGNRHLDRQFWLTDEQAGALVALGYSAPSSPAEALATSRSTYFSVDGTRADGPALAATSVRALREVFGVLHPAFLLMRGEVRTAVDGVDDGTVPDSALPLTPDGMPVSGTLASQWALAEAGPIAMPDSPAHLRRLIEQALVPLLGRRPLVDEDGDFVVPCAGSLVFVRVVDSAPVVAVFCQVERGTVGAKEAVLEVAELNAAVEMVKFFLVDDRIVAGCTLPANPFVGGHLREMLTLVGTVANDFRELPATVETPGPAYGA